jgi:hypothetical protein
MVGQLADKSGRYQHFDNSMRRLTMSNGSEGTKAQAASKESVKKKAEKTLEDAAWRRAMAAEGEKKTMSDKANAALLAIRAKVQAAVGVFESATGTEFDPGNEFHLQLLLEIIKELEATKEFHVPEEGTKPADTQKPKSGK